MALLKGARSHDSSVTGRRSLSASITIRRTFRTLRQHLAELVPDYQFALRHHSPQLMETVLYCWTELTDKPRGTQWTRSNTSASSWPRTSARIGEDRDFIGLSNIWVRELHPPRLCAELHLARPAGHPGAAGPLRHPGADLDLPARPDHRDRHRPWRLAGDERLDAGAAGLLRCRCGGRRARSESQPAQGRRRRHRHPRAQPRRHRRASDAPQDPRHPGLVDRAGDRRRRSPRTRRATSASWCFSIPTTRMTMCWRSSSSTRPMSARARIAWSGTPASRTCRTTCAPTGPGARATIRRPRCGNT